MSFDLPRLMGVIYPVVVVGLIILFLVSFYLFVKRIVTSRRNTEMALRNIEHKLELILHQINTKEALELKREVKGADES